MPEFSPRIGINPRKIIIQRELLSRLGTIIPFINSKIISINISDQTPDKNLDLQIKKIKGTDGKGGALRTIKQIEADMAALAALVARSLDILEC